MIDILSPALQLDRHQVFATYVGLFDGIPDAILTTDQNGYILLVNKAAEKMFGYERSELLGTAVEKLMPASVRVQHLAHRTLYSDDPVAREMTQSTNLEALRKDGELVTVAIQLYPFTISKHQLYVAVIRDVTKTRELQHKIEMLQSRLHSFLELMPEGTIVVNGMGVIIAANQKLCQLSGHSERELADNSVANLFADLPTPDEYSKDLTYETEIQRKDGTTVPVGVRGRDAEFQKERLTIFTVRNITQRVAERQILEEQFELATTLLDAQRDLVLRTHTHPSAGKADSQQTDPATGTLNRKAVEAALTKLRQEGTEDYFAVLFALREGPTLKTRYGRRLIDQVTLVASQLIGNELADAEILGRWSEYGFVAVVKRDRSTRAVEREMRRLCSKRLEHFSDRGAEGEVMVILTITPVVIHMIEAGDNLVGRLDLAVERLTPEPEED